MGRQFLRLCNKTLFFLTLGEKVCYFLQRPCWRRRSWRCKDKREGNVDKQEAETREMMRGNHKVSLDDYWRAKRELEREREKR